MEHKKEILRGGSSVDERRAHIRPSADGRTSVRVKQKKDILRGGSSVDERRAHIRQQTDVSSSKAKKRYIARWSSW